VARFALATRSVSNYRQNRINPSIAFDLSYKKALMDAAKSLIPSELIDFLLNIAPIRPVFIWGPPGIGKFSLVEAFADSVGLPCVSLLGSQLAP
jgi:replication-associated recombination protein RarA